MTNRNAPAAAATRTIRGDVQAAAATWTFRGDPPRARLRYCEVNVRKAEHRRVRDWFDLKPRPEKPDEKVSGQLELVVHWWHNPALAWEPFVNESTGNVVLEEDGAAPGYSDAPDGAGTPTNAFKMLRGIRYALLEVGRFGRSRTIQDASRYRRALESSEAGATAGTVEIPRGESRHRRRADIPRPGRRSRPPPRAGAGQAAQRAAYRFSSRKRPRAARLEDVWKRTRHVGPAGRVRDRRPAERNP